MVVIKGHEFESIVVRDSYDRRALRFKNRIMEALRKFQLTEDDIEIPMEKMALRKAPASVAWYLWDQHLFFSYNGANKFAENLAMVAQVIEYFVDLLDSGEIVKEEFISLFVEDEDVHDHRKEAREILGVPNDSMDFETMHKNYKKLSKELHPDMPGGDADQFKKINRAHKILKKEFENNV